MNIVSRVLTTPECGLFLPLAMNRARELFRVLERDGKKVGARRYEVKQDRQGFYIDIRIQMPNVWILIDTKKCPGFLSGLVWVEDYFEPTVTVDEVDYLRSFYPRATPTTKTQESQLAEYASQLRTVRSGMYSGEMRKVVQVLQGMGVEIAYNYRATETHGVYRTASGAPWIVKVSRAGVFAWPMNICQSKNSPEGLTYTPLPTPEPEESRELLSAAAMEAVYEDKGGFYGGCGWAFSESGAKAANCFVGSRDMYSYSWQYQISIQADDAGNPASASVAVLAEGYIHGPKTTHMKFPRADAPTALFSFNPYRGNANYVHDCEAPVFCYFDGESLQTYYYVYAPSSSFSRTDSFTDGRSGLCTEFLNTMLYSGNYSETAIPVIKLNSTQGERKVVDGRNTYLLTEEGPLGIGWQANEVDDNTFLHLVYYMVRTRQSGRDVVSNDKVNVLIVTGYDRESAYLASQEENRISSMRFYIVKNGISKYYVRYERVEPCDATADFRSISVMGKSIAGENYADASCHSGFRLGELVGYYIVPGAGVGTLLEWRKQRGYVPGYNGCLSIYEAEWTFISPNNNDVPTVDIDTPAHYETHYTLSLRASGGMRAAVNATNEEIGDWIQFIELGMNDQTAFVLRDAFEPRRCAYTRAVNNTRGKDLIMAPGFAPYDLSAVTGSTLSFVGVP